MDVNQDDGGIDIGGNNRQRKFGLPGWMVNNIERLNFVTDFEQYACSPPETEGFLSEHIDSSEGCPIVEPIDVDENKMKFEFNAEPDSGPPSRLLPSPSEFPPCHPVFGNMKQEDLYSSPDSTPCVTPEQSPVIRRKVSIPHPGDTMQTNPGRWFYMGQLKKGHSPKKSNKENTGVDERLSKSKSTGIKLVISNFDLNAVSPTSW